jgi:hypothetical protein
MEHLLKTSQGNLARWRTKGKYYFAYYSLPFERIHRDTRQNATVKFVHRLRRESAGRNDRKQSQGEINP